MHHPWSIVSISHNFVCGSVVGVKVRTASRATGCLQLQVTGQASAQNLWCIRFEPTYSHRIVISGLAPFYNVYKVLYVKFSCQDEHAHYASVVCSVECFLFGV